MKKISCFFFGLLSLNTILKSQPGSLDESFGAGGKVINEAFTGYCNAIAEQADGKIITGGILDAFKEDSTGIIIVRFNADGSLDENFGETGRVIAYKAEGGRAANVYAIAVQANCKIIICATFIKRPDDIDDVDVGLIRLNTDGTFDNSFGGNGVAIISIGKNDRVGDMALQPDGKIIVTGTKGADENEAQPIYIIRFLTNGELDESFGENGIALAPEIIDLRYVNPIVLQTDGKILVGGESFDSSYILVRFLPDGHIDSTFDEDRDGVASIKFEEIDLRYADLYDITVQPDGKILAAGTGGYDLSRIAIARFNSDGSVDSAFGDKPGYSILAMDSGFARASDVYTTDNNSILLTGSYITGVNSNMAVVKYKDDGTLDSSFGENGLALGNLISEGLKIGTTQGILQNDGKIVTGGYTYLLPGDDFPHVVLMRFNGGKQNNPPEFAKIQKWQGHYGFTWNSWPGNKTTYYSVGRSTNASSFTEIAQVTDVPKQKKYKFEDPNPLSGIVYYRLTAVRTDGVMVNSNIITCGNDSGFVQLYPNPAKNSLRVEGLSATEKTKLSILDFSGYTKLVTTVTGSSYNFNIAQLKPGNYMLVIETKGNMVTKKFVKEQ